MTGPAGAGRASGFEARLSDRLAADKKLAGAVFENGIYFPAFGPGDRGQRSFVDKEPVEPGAALAAIFILV